MRPTHIAAIALTAGLVLAGCQAPTTVRATATKPMASTVQKKRPAPAVQQPSQILVKFKAQMAANALESFRAEFGTRNVGTIANLGIYVEEVTTRTPVQQVLKAMKASPLVEYAELNGEVGIQ